MTADPGTRLPDANDPLGVTIEATNLDALLESAHGSSPQLRTLAAIMKASQQPMFVMWGRSQQLFYNDAYAAILHDRHPAAFGRPMLQVWAEIADAIEPLVARAYAGESIHMDDILLLMVRNGLPQETHFSFSYTPVHGDKAGDVLGVFCACAETTDAVRQAKLREAEETRRLQLFRNAPGFMAVLRGPEHVCEFANDACLRAVGGRELIGRSVRQAFPEIGPQGLLALLDGVYASGQRHLGHDMAVDVGPRADGAAETRFIDFVFEPITDANGTVTGIFVEGFDTSDRVLALRAAREVDARRKQVLDSISEGFIVLDEAFRVLEINAEGVRLDGRPASQIVGQVHWELWPASVGTPIETNYRRAMTQRVAVQFQHRYQDAGHDVCLDIRAFPVTGGIAAFYRDVTSLATTAAALQHSNDRFQAAMRAIGVMWTNDAQGQMNGPQPGWSGLTGQTEAQYSGFGWATAVHPDDVQPSLDAWTEAVAAQRLFSFEHRVRRRDGAWRRFAIRAVPVVEHDGSLREWVGVHVDITDATLASEALRTADRRKDEFLATLAHELRNPLGPIRSAASLLARPDLPPDRVGWASGVIARQSHTMGLLLDELLDLARFRSGNIAMKPERVEVAALIESAIETVHHLLDSKGHQLDVRLPDTTLWLEVDRLRTTQVLINLLTNASKYTDRGGRLCIAAGQIGDGIRIDVIDNGIGMAAQSIPEIFEMFAQVPGAAQRSDGGLGIGLTLSKRLVELQGGRIEAFSEGLGTGSTFRVSFPVSHR